MDKFGFIINVFVNLFWVVIMLKYLKIIEKNKIIV